MQGEMPEYHEELPNGSRLHLLPRQNYHQVVAMLSVDFGARDRDVVVNGQATHFHAGLAHFIEHKIFAQPTYDAFTKLSELGANANAFTTQTRTSYFLSTARHSEDAIKELLTFTQEPYFEVNSVAREAEIISQEIDMYDDDVNARLYRLILRRLYQGDGLADDIAGTAQSVHAITVEELSSAYQVAYQPANIDIVITGKFDLAAMRTLVLASPLGQKKAGQQPNYLAHQLQPVSPDILEVEMPVVRNKVAFGQRWYEGIALPVGQAALRQAIAISLAIDLVFSEHSDQYMTWYDDGLIDDSFVAEFDWERGAAYLTIAAETAEPEQLHLAIRQVLLSLPEHFAQLKEQFMYVHRDAVGHLIAKFDQLEEIATRFEGPTFGNATVQDELAVLQALDFDTVDKIIKNVPVSEIATVFVRPKM